MSKNDMISVFNHLTKELDDCTLFEKLLDLHYQKFKYFYAIVERMDLDNVKEIKCEEKLTTLCIKISFKNKKDRDKFSDGFYDTNASYHRVYSGCFKIDVEKDKNKLNISIENKNICREEDIYEDRFDTDR